MSTILCIGKNYGDHAKELGDAIPEDPVVFLKPEFSLASTPKQGDTLKCILPKNNGSVHYECEIVLKLNAKGDPVAFTLGLDLTLRDLQADLKKKGLPWELAKVFQGSAVVGPWMSTDFPESRLDSPFFLDTEFQFVLDGVTKQKARGNQMRFSPQFCIDFIQKYFPIQGGDLLFTGTPAGVGPLHPGQKADLIWDGKVLYSVEFT